MTEFDKLNTIEKLTGEGFWRVLKVELILNAFPLPK